MGKVVGTALVAGLFGFAPSTASADFIQLQLSVCGNADGSQTGCHGFLGGFIDLSVTTENNQLRVVARNNIAVDPSANIDSLGFDFAIFGADGFGASLVRASAGVGDSINTRNINIVSGAGGNFFIDFGFSVPGGPARDAFNPDEELTVVLNTYLQGTVTPVTIDLDPGVLANARIQTSNVSYTLSNPPTSVPEPSSLILLGMGALGACWRARRRSPAPVTQ